MAESRRLRRQSRKLLESLEKERRSPVSREVREETGVALARGVGGGRGRSWEASSGVQRGRGGRERVVAGTASGVESEVRRGKMKRRRMAEIVHERNREAVDRISVLEAKKLLREVTRTPN